MSAAEPEIRPATPDEAGEIVALWTVCSPHSIWTKLGEPLASVYFRRFCQEGPELGVVARLDGALVGACLGTERPGTYVRDFYREHGRELVGALARTVARRPAVTFAIAARFTRGAIRSPRRVAGGRPRGQAQSAISELASLRVCYMSDFFVSPEVRGRGLATLMLERFCREMTSRGCQACLVHTTVDNHASQSAQRRAGFEQFARDGADLTFMRRLTP